MIHWLRTIPIIYLLFSLLKIEVHRYCIEASTGLENTFAVNDKVTVCLATLPPTTRTADMWAMFDDVQIGDDGTQRRRSLWMSIPSSGFCGKNIHQPGCGVSTLADGAVKGAHVLEMWNYCRNIFKHCLHVCPILWPLAPHHFLTLSPCANVANKSAETLRIVLHSVFILTRAFWNTFTGSKWH